VWYNNNISAVEDDRDRAACSSNYKQLQLLRGNGIIGRDDWEKTRSKRISWYRNGGSELVENEKYLASMCSNWRQFQLLTKGSSLRHQELDEGEDEPRPTRGEKLKWYRDGGKVMVDQRNDIIKDSENWMQYRLTRDARSHAEAMYDAVQANYSHFKSKEALSDHMFAMRKEGVEERTQIRTTIRTKNILDSVTKAAYDYHLQPYAHYELEEASSMSAESRQKIAMFEENLRKVTEEVMMMRTQYEESAHELAMRAIKEDEAAVAASRMKRKTTVVEQASSQAVAA